MSKIFFGCFLLLSMVHCQNIFRGSRTYVITKRLFSPDKSHVAITFYEDYGAMGESISRASVLKVPDTFDVRQNMLPCFDLAVTTCYYPNKWINDSILQVTLYERPFVQAGHPLATASFMLNGIRIKVVPTSYSSGLPPVIKYFSVSPDRKKILVLIDMITMILLTIP